MSPNRSDYQAIINRIYLSLLLLISVVAVSIGLGFGVDYTQKWTEHTIEVQRQINKVSYLIREAESEERGYLASADTSFINSYRKVLPIIDANIDALSRMIQDNPTQTRNVRKLDSLRAIRNTELLQNIASFDKSKFIQWEPFDFTRMIYGKEIMAQIETLINEMLQHENDLLVHRERNRTITFYLSLLFYAICLLLLVYLTLRIQRQLSPFFDLIMKSNLQLEQVITDKNSEIEKREKQEIVNQKLIGQLKEKNTELNKFAYIASHDLQEPLRTVDSFIELFEEEYKEVLEEKGDAKLYFDFITKATERMRNLINGLLQYSRLGKSSSRSAVDLGQIVDEIKRDYQLLLQERSAVLERGELPIVDGFRMELKQLFTNLISNSIKFVPQNRTPSIRISSYRKSNRVVVEIQDNGIGIPEKSLSKIFDMYKRLHSQNTFSGIGLGLAFCKKIVELHQGTIKVQSEEGKGSTFIISLPLVSISS